MLVCMHKYMYVLLLFHRLAERGLSLAGSDGGVSKQFQFKCLSLCLKNNGILVYHGSSCLRTQEGGTYYGFDFSWNSKAYFFSVMCLDGTILFGMIEFPQESTVIKRKFTYDLW